MALEVPEPDRAAALLSTIAMFWGAVCGEFVVLHIAWKSSVTWESLRIGIGKAASL